MIFRGSELVVIPLAHVVDDSMSRRGWKLTVRGRSPIMLAGPAEELTVLVDGVIEGMCGDDPRRRWIELRDDAIQRLAVVEQARSGMRRMYATLDKPVRPVSPAWLPAGALAALVGLIGVVVSAEPPPPTVLSLQLTSTSASPETMLEPSTTYTVEAESTAVAGSTTTPACHASYVGGCVPVDVVDVDCKGGSDDGPYYVGEVEVIGLDVYGLDPDGDGVACDE
jgi:hypothetical protein